MKNMSKILTRFTLAGLCTAGSLLAGFAYGASNGPSGKPEPLTAEEKAHFEQSARSWIKRLWTNDYSGCTAKFNTEIYNFRPWTTNVDVAFRLDGKRCTFGYRDRNPDKLTFIRNELIKAERELYEKNYKPIHTTEEQARARAAECAALFGVTNLWDDSAFLCHRGMLDYGNWTYGFLAKRNGHLCPFGVFVDVADRPGAPLYMWSSTLDNFPANMPTNVVLTSEQARGKAEGYLKKYFPVGELAPGSTFHTNTLQYVFPNYNYIRPAPGNGGFSTYVAAKDEIKLVWYNWFDAPGEKLTHPVRIYVDAVTGEMLGGED